MFRNRCSQCGRQLKAQAASAIHPPTCMSCDGEHVSKIKTKMIKNIATSVVLMIVGIVLNKNPMEILFAGIPYGWAILNSITPVMFLWLDSLFSYKTCNCIF